MNTVAFTVPSWIMNRSAPLCGDRGEHVEREPGTGRLDYGCTADRGPGGAGVVVRADPGLVGEVDRGPLGLGLRADTGTAPASSAAPLRGSAGRPGRAGVAGTGPWCAAADP